MANLQITNNGGNLSIITPSNGVLRVTHTGGGAIPSIPINITIRVTGWIPESDFNIEGFVWSYISGNIWEGIYTTEVDQIPNLGDLDFTIVPRCNSQIGNFNATFTLQSVGGEYTAAGAAPTFILEGNSKTNLLYLTPTYVTYDNTLDVLVKRWAHCLISNQHGANNYLITNLSIPEDVNNHFDIYVENAGGWSIGLVNFTINAGNDKEIFVQCNATTALGYADYRLRIDYSIGGVAQDPLYWAFQPDTKSEAKVVGTYASDIDVNDPTPPTFTWLDGSTKSATFVANVLDLGNLFAVDILGVDSDIPLNVKNSTADTVRVGNKQAGSPLATFNGWFGEISGNEASDGTPDGTADTDYTILTTALKQLILRISGTGSSENLGSHTAIFQINTILNEIEADITTTTRTNPGVEVDLATPLAVTSAGAPDVIPIPVSTVVQGDGALRSSWSGDAKNTGLVFTGGAFTIGINPGPNGSLELPVGTHHLTMQYVTPDASATCVTREIGVFQGAAAGAVEGLVVVEDSLLNVSNESIITVTVTGATDNTFVFAAYLNDANPTTIVDVFNVFVRTELKVNWDHVNKPQTMQVNWFVAKSDLAVTNPSSGTLAIDEFVGSNTNHNIVLRNDGNISETITNITFSGTPAGFTFVGGFNIVIPVGASHTFTFNYNPQSPASTAHDITFVKSEGGNKVVPLTLLAQAVPDICEVAPNPASYTFDVIQNVPVTFSQITIDTGNNTGDLFIDATAAPSLSFLEDAQNANPAGQVYKISNAQANTSYVIPIKVLATSYPVGGTTIETLTYTMNVGSTGIPPGPPTVVCSSTFEVTLNVTEDTSISCPSAYSPAFTSIQNLDPSDTGDIDIDFLFGNGLGATQLDGAVIQFILSEVTIHSWPTQDPIAGVTWAISTTTLADDTLTATITNAYATKSLPIKIEYAIAAGGNTSYINTASVTASATYGNTQYSCSGLVHQIAESVEIIATYGGYATSVTIEEITECTTARWVDGSNFGADTQHTKALMNLWRKAVITKPDGTEYVMATHGTYDELIQPASSTILTYNFDIDQGGVYQVDLYQVPTWSAATYAENDIVAKLVSSVVRFFQVTSDSGTNKEPLVTADWDDDWDEIPEKDIAGTPYGSTAYYLQRCELDNCLANSAKYLFCEFEELCKQTNCSHECFCNYQKIRAYDRGITEATLLNRWDSIRTYYNAITELCNCSPCGEGN
jgi:hypothetical protein